MERQYVDAQWKGCGGGTHESIDLSADIDKNANLTCPFLLALYRKCSENSGLHLITEAGNRGSNAGSHIPSGRVLQLESPSQQASKNCCESNI